MITKPTSEQLQQSIGVICKVIGQIPCFHVYEENVAQRFSATEIETALRAMMHNAALDSTLISLRCFNEFFGSHRRDDDIRASDFPGVTIQPFLSRDDENAIHKYLAHITVTRFNTATKPWFIDHMVIFGLQHSVEFLSIIEDTFPPNAEAGRIELSCVREAARLLIPKIVSLQETKRD